ncbi:MAG TPA: hypothetical protein PLW31_14300 [Bacteroidales bacterium]|nr:hypothetical protein [Bacteroidales bacterium]HNQ83328.1 hypothetical protein [Bacteroidales bacterium]HOX79197.1 hypothetical protein [Bacteroidales bacterium]HPM91355.1 hypothetical protein [Bacteroidales bacterium]
MKKYLINTAIFILAFLILVIALALASSRLVYKRAFRNWEVEGNLLVMKSNHDYNLLMMGISHARNFSRHKNHLRMEKILHQEIINIGIGEGKCGAIDQHFFLEYFYYKRNSADRIFYVMSPTLLNKGFINRASNTFEFEPFRLDFFIKYLGYKSDNKYERLFYYVKSKFARKWYRLQPRSLDEKKSALKEIDSTKIKEGLKLLLVDGERMDEFQRNCLVVEETIKLAKEHNTEVIFFIPPALFGKWEGHYETMDFLEEMYKKYGTRYYDFSESVLIPEYYYDHHHLNSKGIEYFAENYLKGIL